MVSYPALTYWRTNSDRPISNDGATGQCIAIFQIDAWASDIFTCWELLDAARLATNCFSGTGNGTQIDCIRWEDEQDWPGVVPLPGRQKATQRSTARLVISYTDNATVPPPAARAFSAGFSSGFN